MSDTPTKGETQKDDDQKEIDRQNKIETDITYCEKQIIRGFSHGDRIPINTPHWPEPEAISELKIRFAAKNLNVEFTTSRTGGWISWSK